MSDSSRNLHENHRARVRKRFEHEGLKTFADHNVLELLLFYSIPQKDTNDIAHRLLDEFGSLSAVFDAPKDVLMNVVGVGENTATLIKLMPELFSRYEQDKIKTKVLFLILLRLPVNILCRGSSGLIPKSFMLFVLIIIAK